MRAIGVDIGSLTTKAVILEIGGIASQLITKTGDDIEPSVRSAVRTAMEQASLTGETYDLWMLPNEKIHDYCSKGKIKYETVEFKEDGSFVVESLEEESWGEPSEGEFNEAGMQFTAEYEVHTDWDEKYSLRFKGFILNDFIIGSCIAKYYELEWDGWDKEDEAKLFFIGAPGE